VVCSAASAIAVVLVVVFGAVERKRKAGAVKNTSVTWTSEAHSSAVLQPIGYRPREAECL